MEAINYLLTNVLLPLVVGGIGVYGYPRLESYLKNRSLSSNRRKLIEIVKEYGLVRSFKENPTSLVTNMLFYIILGLIMLLLVIFLIGVGVYAPLSSNSILRFITVIAFGYTSVYPVSFLMRAAKRYTYTLNMRQYRDETITQLKKLDMKIEILDDIDNLSREELESFVESLKSKEEEV